MKNNKTLKIIVDLILILFTLIIFTVDFSNSILPKILEVSLFIATLFHIILHKDKLFIKKVPINNYNAYYNNIHEKITFAINIFLCISLIILASTSIIQYKLIPNFVLRKLYTNSYINMFFISSIHTAFITISLILIAIHVGMNIHIIFDLFTNNKGKINYIPALLSFIIIIAIMPAINFYKSYNNSTNFDNINYNKNNKSNAFSNGNNSYDNNNSDPFSNGYNSYGNNNSDPFSNGYDSYGNDNSDPFSNGYNSYGNYNSDPFSNGYDSYGNDNYNYNNSQNSKENRK